MTDATRMPILASACSDWVSNARPVMNSETVKPIPATAPTPAMWRQPAPSGSRPSPSRTASQLNAVMPIELADHERDRDADEHAGTGRRHGVAGQLDAGVGEGEDRHDHVARPRVQRVDQPVAGRHRSADQTGCGADLVGAEVVAVLEHDRRSRRPRARSATAAPGSAAPARPRRWWRARRTRTPPATARCAATTSSGG